MRGYSGTRETIILVHGIWMPGAIMSMLKYRLKRHGFSGRLFDYFAVNVGLDDNAERLASALQAAAAGATRAEAGEGTRAEAGEGTRAEAGEGRVHLVGHSLGGVLALRAHRLHPEAPPGRIVCLGSPLCGSRAAVGLGHWRLGQRMLGRTLTAGVVEEAADCWGVDVALRREVGIIAGTRPLGLGHVVAGFGEDNDGTVAVSETRLPGAADHLLMPVTHTGLVWSRAVADQVATFLRHGHFTRPAE